METTREKTCNERIAKELRGRLEDIRIAQENEDKREEFDESILAVSKQIVYRVELSYGGPQDYFNIYIDPESQEITRITYHFLDWFDGAIAELTGRDFDTVADYFGYLAEA